MEDSSPFKTPDCPLHSSSTFSLEELKKFSEGTHYELYQMLGSTFIIREGIKGVRFAVWAPFASSVSLMCDTNSWDPSSLPMKSVSNGIWEIFLPGIKNGEKYKYRISTQDGKERIKADPFAFFHEKRPLTASIVYDIENFPWSDEKWMKERNEKNLSRPINIYELHLGSWKKRGEDFLDYRKLAKELVIYCKKMGYTHIELLPIKEHPLDESWGYQVTGYFAPTSRFGTPLDFQFFINTMHENGIGVFLDWVPAHFPRDPHSLHSFDGTALFEDNDEQKGFHPKWTTAVFDYTSPQVCNFLLASALFWIEKMHLDGLRMDAVTSIVYLDHERTPGQWKPNKLGNNHNLEGIAFIQNLNKIIHKRNPSALMIAEESSTFPGVTKDPKQGGLGFDMKWNMGWMNDTLRYFSFPFSKRSSLQHLLTFGITYLHNEKFLSVFSHDEVVHEKRSLLEKMPGTDFQKFAQLRLLLSYSISYPGKKLLFMGGEIGQRSEWNPKDELHWDLLEKPLHNSLHLFVQDLNKLYLNTPPLWEKDFEEKGFSWVSHEDHFNSVISYLRKGETTSILCAHNFGIKSLTHYFLPLQEGEKIEEIFNSDSSKYGGSDKINNNITLKNGGVYIDLPPLASLIFSIV